MSGRAQKDEYGLTPQQRKFADLHRLYRDRADKFDYDAYLESFPTTNSDTAKSNASRVLRYPEVAAYIAMRDSEMAAQVREEHDVSVSQLVAELTHGALYNIQELLDKKGRVRNVADLPEHIARAIVSVKTVTNKRGEVVHEIKMMDKAACIDKLMKYLGGYAAERAGTLTVDGEIRHSLGPAPEVQEILDAVYQHAGRE